MAECLDGRCKRRIEDREPLRFIECCKIGRPPQRRALVEPAHTGSDRGLQVGHREHAAVNSKLACSRQSVARKHRLRDGRHRSGDVLARIAPPEGLEQPPKRAAPPSEKNPTSATTCRRFMAASLLTTAAPYHVAREPPLPGATGISGRRALHKNAKARLDAELLH
jgi:hypothetical protein